MYNLTLKTPPLVEPITLQEVKDFLKISDYADTTDGLTIEECILPANRTPSTTTGNSIDILGYAATVEIIVGTIATGGKLNCKIQESSDNSTWIDWYSFSEITPSNDNATIKYQYTGDCRYIRVVAVLTTANADFACNVILNQGYTSEDTYLSSLITAARQYCESYQNRAYITQVWEMAMDEFPCNGVIELPKGKLQSVDSIKYKDYAGVETTLTLNTDYIYSTRSIKGKIVPVYGKVFPTFTPYPLDPIVITFTCGYGANGSYLPKKTIQAMKLLISHWFSNRTPISQTMASANELDFTLSALLWQERLVNI
jgi:uncharacterized phiE125 gp8 family phage protein